MQIIRNILIGIWEFIELIGMLIIGWAALAMCIEYPIMWLPTIIGGLKVYRIKSDKKEESRRKYIEKKHRDTTFVKAKNGDPASKFTYGEIVLYGRGVLADEKVGMNWIKSAALMNEPRALFKMGEAYDKGLYQYSINKLKARDFFEKAAHFGHKEAKIIIDSLLAEKDRRYKLEEENRQKRSSLETNLSDIYFSAWSRYNALGDARKIDTMTGIEFERFVGKLFISMGYEITFTSASGDQGTDIIAKKDRDKVSVQVKRYKKSVGNSAVQEAISGAHYHSCNKACVVTNSIFTKSAKELAKRSKTELIGGEKLFSLIENNFESGRVEIYSHDHFISSKEEILSFFPELRDLAQSVKNNLSYLNNYSHRGGSGVACRSLEWKYQCPLKWENLVKTPDENVKYCCECESSVYFSNDPRILEKYSLEGKCTASNLQIGKENSSSLQRGKYKLDKSMILLGELQ